MKKCTNYLGFMCGILFLSSLSACQPESILEQDKVIEPESVISFMGLKVRKPAGVSAEVLQSADGDQLLAFFNRRYGGSAQARVASLNSAVPHDLFYGTLEKVIKRYPTLDFQNYDEKTLIQIYQDFPDLKTEQQVQKHSHEVATYYERLITNEFQAELTTVRATLPSAKRAFDYANTNNAYVNQLANQYSVYGYHIERAAYDALNWTQEYFGDGLAQRNRADCFRHCIWNVESCRKMFNLGYNKWEVLERVRQFATAHEHVTNNGPWYLPNDELTIMDLHNNAFGRTYAKNATGTSLADRATNIPSQDKIKSDFVFHVNNTNYIKIRSTGTEILNLVYGDINVLANVNYFPYDYGAALEF